MRPNIVLITIDCWRFDRLSSRTKILQKLAEKGVSFQAAYTAGGWTQAAFPALLTSTYGSMYDGCLGPLSEKRPYLPEWLQERGYRTLAVQTSPLLDENYGYGRGMNELISLQPAWQAPSWYGIKGMQHMLQRNGFHRFAQAVNIQSRPAPAYANAEEATEQAIALVARSEEPFFLWVHYMDAHWPYFDEEGHETAKQLAQSWKDRHKGHLAMRRKERQQPSPATLKQWVTMHDAALQSIDKQIGRLLHSVEQQTGENLLTIVTGDHGEEFYEHGNFGHGAGTLYEEILHVPLIAICPKLFPRKIVEEPVSLLDIAPTITDLIDSEIPSGMLGESFLSLVNDASSSSSEPKVIIADSYWEDDAHLVAIRVGDFKFIINLGKPDNWRLYDLGVDPAEENNLRPDIPADAPDFWTLLDKHMTTVRTSRVKTAETTETQTADTDLLNRLRDLGYVD